MNLLSTVPESAWLEALRSTQPASHALIESAGARIQDVTRRAALLRLAAQSNQHAAIGSLLAQGFPLDELAILWAARSGHAESLRAFFAAGCDPLAYDGEILVEAAGSSSLAALDAVLDAAREWPALYLLSALKAALANGGLRNVMRLAARLEGRVPSSEWEELLLSAKLPGGRCAGMQMRALRAALGIDLAALERHALADAIRDDDAMLVSSLLYQGCDPVGERGASLMLAFRAQHEEITDMLADEALNRRRISRGLLTDLSNAGFSIECCIVEMKANARGYAWPS